jgi:hypothetical protein
MRLDYGKAAPAAVCESGGKSGREFGEMRDRSKGSTAQTHQAIMCHLYSIHLASCSARSICNNTNIVCFTAFYPLIPFPLNAVQ